MTTWAETFAGADGAPWPFGWSTSGVGETTLQGGRGRLTAGPGDAYAAVRSRYTPMTDQRDVEVLVTFTPQTAGTWYLTIGARTQSDDPATPNDAFTQYGAYIQFYNFFGAGIWIVRRNGGHDNLITTQAGLPAFTAGTTYKARLRFQGMGMYARLWAATGPEPTAWSLVFTDPDAYMEPGKVTFGYNTGSSGTASSLDLDEVVITSVDPDPDFPADSSVRHTWEAWARDTSYKPSVELPIRGADLVLRHLGVGQAILTTPYTDERWAGLGPGRGVIIYRDGKQLFSGRTAERDLDWDESDGTVVIKVKAFDELIHLQDALVFPDPTRAPADQTVSDYWKHTGTAAAAMRQLIVDQIGPTAHVTHRISGVTVGAAPAGGTSRAWSALFDADGGVLGTLTRMSVTSGENLGVRASTSAGVIAYDIVRPRDLTHAVKFSVEFGNVAGIHYSEKAPTVTDSLSAGQGDLKLRKRRYAATAAPAAVAWGRRIWSYIDRRDTADDADLDEANAEALAEGDVTVSFTATLLDTPAASWRQDYDLGDRVTVFVRVPGQEGPVATVADLVREVAIKVTANGVESITPAIGSYDAKAAIPTPTQQQLARVGQSLAGLRARK